MLIKQQVMVADPIAFKRGNFRSCFGLCHPDDAAGMERLGWIPAATVEFDIDVHGESVDATIKAALEREKSELRAKIHLIEQQEKELFSIAHQNDPIQPMPTATAMYGDEY